MIDMNRRSFLRRALATAGILALGRPALADDGPGSYDAAEWGVFVLEGDDPAGLTADLQADVPAFVHCPRRDVVEFVRAAGEHENAPVVVFKPVVWFRSDRPRTVAMAVDFPGGRPLLWWPGADWKEQRLEWVVEILARGAAEPDEAVEAGHWFGRLRRPPANPVRVDGKVEGFVYYDGRTSLVNRIAAVPDGAAVVLENGYDHPIHDGLVVWTDRASGRPIACRAVGTVAPGARVEVAPGIEVGPERLAADLAATDLPAEEAAAFAEVWTDDLFGRPGLTFAFRLPREVYDAVLPLTLAPPPRRLARVGYCLAVDLDPDLAARIDALVAALGADDWKTRQAAATDLSNLGPTALPALRRAAEGAGDLHLRSEAARLSDRIAARLDPDAIPERYRQHYDEWKRTGRVAPESLWGERGLGRR